MKKFAIKRAFNFFCSEIAKNIATKIIGLMAVSIVTSMTVKFSLSSVSDFERKKLVIDSGDLFVKNIVEEFDEFSKFAGENTFHSLIRVKSFTNTEGEIEYRGEVRRTKTLRGDKLIDFSVENEFYNGDIRFGKLSHLITDILHGKVKCMYIPIASMLEADKKATQSIINNIVAFDGINVCTHLLKEDKYINGKKELVYIQTLLFPKNKIGNCLSDKCLKQMNAMSIRFENKLNNL
jgi:hypothetical protein